MIFFHETTTIADHNLDKSMYFDIHDHVACQCFKSKSINLDTAAWMQFLVVFKSFLADRFCKFRINQRLIVVLV